METNNKFGIFIITHGRAHSLTTLETLRNGGIEDNVYLIVDNEDSDLADYEKIANTTVKVFDKEAEVKLTDSIMNNPIRKCGLFARHFCERCAAGLGFDTFVMLDDDIKQFYYRVARGKKSKSFKANNIKKVFELFSNYVFDYGLGCVSSANESMMIGMNAEKTFTGWKVNCRNVLFRNVRKVVNWRGVFMDDYLMPYTAAIDGAFSFGVPFVEHVAVVNGKMSGGMQEAYLNNEDYTRFFYAVVAMPGCCEIKLVEDGVKFSFVNNRSMPKLISSSYRKA